MGVADVAFDLLFGSNDEKLGRDLRLVACSWHRGAVLTAHQMACSQQSCEYQDNRCMQAVPWSSLLHRYKGAPPVGLRCAILSMSCSNS